MAVRSLLITAIAFVAVAPSQALDVGDYYRPSGDEVSGVYGNNATYHRGPCPALNALANHGVLPRDGTNITKDVLRDAIQSVYMLDDTSTQTLLDMVPSTFALDYLSAHNVLEHDASLVHSDAYYGADPAEVNTSLAEDLFSRSQDGLTLGVAEVGAARAARLKDCLASNPECTYGTTQATLAYTEASIFLLGFGGNVNSSVSLDVAYAFMVEERIPDEYVPSETAISLTEVRTVAAKLIAAASS